MTPAPPARSAPHPAVFAAVWAVALTFFAAFYTLLVPLPLYLSRSGLPDWQVAVILGSFGACAVVGRPLTGAAVDRWGPRPVMLIAAGLLAVGAAGTPATVQPLLLLLLRVLQAAGYVAFTTAVTALVADLLPDHGRASGLALFGLAANLAMTLVPAAVGAGLPALGLHGAMLLSAALAGVSGLGALAAPPARPAGGPGGSPGAAAGGPAGAPAAGDPAAGGPAAGGQADATWSRPWRVPAALRRPMLAAAAFGTGYGAFLQFLPLLTERRGLGSAGGLYALYGAGIILTRLLMSRVFRRVPSNRLLPPSFALLAAGLAGYAAGRDLTSLRWATLAVALSSGTLHPALIADHVNLAGAGRRGRAAAAFYLAFDLGIGGGAWLFSGIFEAFGAAGLFLGAALTTAAGVLVTPRPAAVAGRERPLS